MYLPVRKPFLDDQLIRIGNRAWEQDSNPNLERLQAASLEDQGAAHLSQAKSQSKNTNIDLSVVAPEEGLLNLPDGGKKSLSVNFMNLKFSQATNHVQLLEKNVGLRPAPMTQAQEQKTQVAFHEFSTNEKPPSG
ncbi:hypothetical protein DSO57_1036228, partial [Entomophthora muscae]